jgi:hypothetical protein
MRIRRAGSSLHSRGRSAAIAFLAGGPGRCNARSDAHLHSAERTPKQLRPPGTGQHLSSIRAATTTSPASAKAAAIVLGHASFTMSGRPRPFASLPLSTEPCGTVVKSATCFSVAARRRTAFSPPCASLFRHWPSLNVQRARARSSRSLSHARPPCGWTWQNPLLS